MEKGETIYGISRHYGISIEELIEANPQIQSGLKTGVLLNIPSANTTPTTTEDAVSEPVRTQAPIVSADTTENAPSETAPEIESDDEDATDDTDIDQEESPEEEDNSPVKISVILPFMLSESQPDKQTNPTLYRVFQRNAFGRR